MNFGLKRIFFPSNQEERYEAKKLLFLSLSYFFVIATYTLVKELKDSLFINIVGKEYLPWAKLLSMGVLVPAVLFYSFLVDNLRRYQLLRFYSFLYGATLFVFMFLAGHSKIGLANTDTSPYRIFGWLFYFLIEGYSPFVVSVFWAFVNSISNPKAAKNDYSLMVAGSKVGGMVGAGLGMLLFSLPQFGIVLSDVVNHQILLGAAGFFVILVPTIVLYLMKSVPGRFMHGYEAAYKFEKERKKEKKKQGIGILDGLKMFIEYPYVFGIFGMLFFYEIIVTILNYQRLGLIEKSTASISLMTSELFKQAFYMQAVGFVISFIGTRFLLKWLGERVCLLLIPISTGLILFYCMSVYTTEAIVWSFILFRSINYAFAQPLREALYIPTVKEMKFKSKSWIDAFGSKLSKGAGSAINLGTQLISSNIFFAAHLAIFGVLTALWTGVAAIMGKRFTKAIAQNEVIGAD